MSNFDSDPSDRIPPQHFDGFDDQREPYEAEGIDAPGEEASEVDAPDYPDELEQYASHSPEDQPPDLSVAKIGDAALHASAMDSDQFADATVQRPTEVRLDTGEVVMVYPVAPEPRPVPEGGVDDEGKATPDGSEDAARQVSVDNARLRTEPAEDVNQTPDVSGRIEQQARALDDREADVMPVLDSDVEEGPAPVLISFDAIARLALPRDPLIHDQAPPSPGDLAPAAASRIITGAPHESGTLPQAGADQVALAFSIQRTEDAFLRFVEDQRARVAAGEFSDFASVTHDTLFQTFVASPYFSTAYDEAVRRTVVSHNEGTLMRSIKGIFFEQLSYAFTAALGADSGNVVLSPAQTFDLVTYANPDQALRRERGRLRHYPGVNVPDGLVVSPEGVVTGVLEYTLSTNTEKIDPQEAAVATMSPALKALSHDPSFWLAGPHSSPNDLGVEVRLPCNHREFNNFFDYVYKVHRMNEDHATLQEIQAYARELKAVHPELNQRVREEMRLGTTAELDISVVMLTPEGRLKRSNR